MPICTRRSRLTRVPVWSPSMLAVILICPMTAMAGVYKCAGENGTVVYQEDACAVGKELRNFETDPPALSIISGTAVPAPSARPPREARTASLETHESSDKLRGKVSGDATGRKFIRTGMSESEVVAKIGRPDIAAGGNRTHHSRWSYLPTGDDPDTITTITFNGETVSDVTRKLVKR